MRYEAVVFDLDGTLLDTVADIGAAANRVLEGLGRPPHTIAAYRRMVGEGVRVLFERALPEASRSDRIIEECAEAFRAEYGRAWNVATRPFAGVPELLAALAARRVRMAVLSNKPDDFAKRCVAAHFPTAGLHPVLGQRDGVPRKPDPAGALEIIAELAIPRERIAYLGDTAVDMETATAAGLYPVGARWGYRPADELTGGGARALIVRPEELLGLVDGASPPVSPAGSA